VQHHRVRQSHEGRRALSTPPRCRLANRFFIGVSSALILRESRQPARDDGYLFGSNLTGLINGEPEHTIFVG
jgi:hypothetical protein